MPGTFSCLETSRTLQARERKGEPLFPKQDNRSGKQSGQITWKRKSSPNAWILVSVLIRRATTIIRSKLLGQLLAREHCEQNDALLS